MKKLFFVSIAMLAWAVSTAQTGILRKEEYGKHGGEELIEILGSDNPNSPYTTVDAKSLQRIFDDHFSDRFPGETLDAILDGTVLVDAPLNFVQTYQIGYVNDDAGFAWGGRRSGKPYPGEKLLVYKGIAWASAYCWNPVCPKVLPRTSLASVRQRKASYTPPPAMEEYEEVTEEGFTYSDRRQPSRQLKKQMYREEFREPQVQKVIHLYKNQVHWSEAANNVGGALMKTGIGVGVVKVAWDGFKIRNENYNYNFGYNIVKHIGNRPGYRISNQTQLGNDEDDSGGEFDPDDNPFFDGGGRRGPRRYQGTPGGQANLGQLVGNTQQGIGTRNVIN